MYVESSMTPAEEAMIVGLMAGMDPDEIIAVPPRPSWWDGAECRSSGVNFFPERGESTGPAKALCAVCAAQDACLAFAVGEGIEHGVWGGLSPQERREMRRQAAA